MRAGRGSWDDSSGLREHRDLYDHDYFHGKTSGYPPEGYARAHPEWSPWIELLEAIQPQGLLVELGCAYGYLTEAVRGSGRRAVGLDLSGYALSQHPPARPFLVQGDAQKLPFPDGCAHVVTLFDLLEHLPDPRACLREAVRVLGPNGLIAGATPDPLHFRRPEPTHCFERPPSFWISALEELDLAVTYRFSVTPYNFQFLAAFKGSPAAERAAAWRHDYYGPEPEFVSVDGPLEALPRWGWSALEAGSREMQGNSSALYLLNRLAGPVRITTRFSVSSSPDFTTLRVRAGSSTLAEIHLDSERRTVQVELPPVRVAAGGHHLIFEPFPLGPRLRIHDVEIGAEPCSREGLVLGLPFDLYQRYRLASQVGSRLTQGPILDVGGLLGERDGHVATTADFFSGLETGRPVRVRTTDLRHCDHPNHAPAPAWEQPFGDGSFDLVLSLDVLEHLEPERRPDFLSELDRVARSFILIGAPFSTPDVERTEEELAEGLLNARRFLEEHRTLGLPAHDLVESHFSDRTGYEVHRFPSGYLPRWRAMQVLTQHYFQLNDTTSMTSLNRLYNRSCYVADLAEPAYRSLFLISKTPLSDAQRDSLASLFPEPGPESASACGLSALARDAQFPALHQRIRELLQERDEAWLNTRFLINERQKLIRLLRREIRHLRTEVPLWKLAGLRLREKLRRR
ncbi:MAG: methyltransferase domain-containing protein [Acidobacteriota bacterium]|nr:methyltransferase domain-containing protein [Acidobacteriota bacterium]